MPTVSFIMPLYNAETTVGKMVDSIRNQTFTDWELIVVDDGSTDTSGAILDDYAQTDVRIKVIHQKNSGVASARQCGIDHAAGEYIIHADADDWVDADMLESMVGMARREIADIVIADYYVNYPSGDEAVVKQDFVSAHPGDVLFDIYNKKLFGGLWHKLISKRAYMESKARFLPDINYCEDVLLLTQILSNPNLKIVHLPDAFYHYCIVGSSLTRNVTKKGLENLKRFHNAAKSMLPFNAQQLKSIFDEFALSEFKVLFMNKLYNNSSELRDEFQRIKKIAYGSTNSLRWKLGYACLDCGLIGLAHKLLKY